MPDSMKKAIHFDRNFFDEELTKLGTALVKILFGRSLSNFLILACSFYLFLLIERNHFDVYPSYLNIIVVQFGQMKELFYDVCIN